MTEPNDNDSQPSDEEETTVKVGWKGHVLAGFLAVSAGVGVHYFAAQFYPSYYLTDPPWHGPGLWSALAGGFAMQVGYALAWPAEHRPYAFGSYKMPTLIGMVVVYFTTLFTF